MLALVSKLATKVVIDRKNNGGSFHCDTRKELALLSAVIPYFTDF